MTQTNNVCSICAQRHKRETHIGDKIANTGWLSNTESHQINQINNNKQNSASSVHLSCWQRTINYGLPCSLCLALCVSARLRLYNCTQHATVDLWRLHPRPVLQPAVTKELLHAVWLSEESVWVTGPKAESGPANCHFLLSALHAAVYLSAYLPPVRQELNLTGKEV